MLRLCARCFSGCRLRYSKLLLVGLLLFLLVPYELLAIGVSVSPATISAHAVLGKEGSSRFIVSNPSKEVGLFEVYPEEFEEAITLIPSRFVLEAGEKREVLVRAKRHQVGIVRTVIAVEAQSLGVPALGIGGGVRLPFLIEVREGSNLFSAVSASGAKSTLLVFLLGALTVLLLLRRVPLSTLKRPSRGATL